jgi:hypothetical protein
VKEELNVRDDEDEAIRERYGENLIAILTEFFERKFGIQLSMLPLIRISTPFLSLSRDGKIKIYSRTTDILASLIKGTVARYLITEEQ